MCKEIHHEGTVGKIFERNPLINFQEKIKRIFEPKLHLERSRESLLHIGLETLSLQSEFTDRLRQGRVHFNVICRRDPGEEIMKRTRAVIAHGLRNFKSTFPNSKENKCQPHCH